MQPRLIGARATQQGPESLTWSLGADFKDDKHAEWIQVEGKDQVERTIFPARTGPGPASLARTVPHCRNVQG